MEWINVILKLIVGFTILNVWFLRANNKTPYRGGNAKSLKEEFQVYGLSEKVYTMVFYIKSGLAVLLLASIFINQLTRFSVTGIAILMFGAIVMHLKVKDDLNRTWPAILMLIMTLTIGFLSS